MNQHFRLDNLHLRRRKNRFFSFLLTGFLFSLILGCSSSPPPRLYSLGPVMPPTETKDSSLPILYVTSPFLPRYLDRPQIVIRKGERELFMDEKNRWAAPLGDMIREQISAGLNARLDSIRVLSGDRALLQQTVEMRLDIQILDFSSDDRGTTRLSGTYFLWCKTGEEKEIPFNIQTNFKGIDMENRVASFGNALDILCDEIGDTLFVPGGKPRSSGG